MKRMRPICLRNIVTPAVLLAGLLSYACHQVHGTEDRAIGSVSPPAVDATAPVDLPGLHNVVTYAPDMFSGSVPHGREGLAALAAMGIRTVISVDGATPDVATAEELGMRYVHLPFSYDGVPAERRTALAQAVSSCDGPIYVHCHHGKHRSAAGLATALVTAGRLDSGRAEARMNVSGTSPNYAGLWQSVRDCQVLDAEALKVDPASLPSVATVSGMVAMMSEIDVVFENVGYARIADFGPMEDHPDLVPANETKRLHALFEQLKSEPESVAHDDGYQRWLDEAVVLSGKLDGAVRSNDLTAAQSLYAEVRRNCKACHKEYRDR